MFEQYPGTLEQRSKNTGLFLNEIQHTSRRETVFLFWAVLIHF